MRTEQGGGAAGVTVLRRLQDGLVFGGLVLPAGEARRVAGFVPPGGHGDQRGGVAEVVEHPDQQRVAAARELRRVEAAVSRAAFGLATGAGRGGRGGAGPLPV